MKSRQIDLPFIPQYERQQEQKMVPKNEFKQKNDCRFGHGILPNNRIPC